MTRLVFLLLLIVLPLQPTWAVGGGYCPPDGGHPNASAADHDSHAAHAQDHGDGASGHHHHSHAAHAHQHGDGDDGGNRGHAAGADLDCSAFHFVALEPFVASAHSLPQIGVTLHCVEYTGYKSHIPEGPDRPCWRFAI